MEVGEEEEDKRGMGDKYRKALRSYVYSQLQSHFAPYISSYYSCIVPFVTRDCDNSLLVSLTDR